MRSTIRDIAEEAGVSVTTVSLVLRGVDGRTTEMTRQRVLEVAQRLDYLPVKPPTSQNRPLDTRIVTLVPEHRDMERHHLDMFTHQGVISGARQHGYDVLTLVGQEPKQYIGREKSRYLDRRSDGFIFATTTHGIWESALKVVAEHDIPTVVCYRQDVPPNVAFSDLDNAGAMRQAVHHLVENGHERIAYLAGPLNNFNEQERRRGWVKAMLEAGLEVNDEVIVQGLASGFMPNPDAIASVSKLGVTAVVCYNDLAAVLLWDTLEQQGLKIPRDMSIIGMDNTTTSTMRGLSTFTHSFADVGRLAMEAWVELKNGGDAKSCSKLAPVVFIPRGSVRRF
ncbi:LacI family transcriptional regulator [bacterium]|nr:MAG: LacI family transcriptional regulator [bacterium]